MNAATQTPRTENYSLEVQGLLTSITLTYAEDGMTFSATFPTGPTLTHLTPGPSTSIKAKEMVKAWTELTGWCFGTTYNYRKSDVNKILSGLMIRWAMIHGAGPDGVKFAR